MKRRSARLGSADSIELAGDAVRASSEGRYAILGRSADGRDMFSITEEPGERATRDDVERARRFSRPAPTYELNEDWKEEVGGTVSTTRAGRAIVSRHAAPRRWGRRATARERNEGDIYDEPASEFKVGSMDSLFSMAAGGLVDGHVKRVNELPAIPPPKADWLSRYIDRQPGGAKYRKRGAGGKGRGRKAKGAGSRPRSAADQIFGAGGAPKGGKVRIF